MNAIVPIETPRLLSALVEAATDPTVDVVKLDALLAMHERMQAKQSEQAFSHAMNAAQSEMSRISADAYNTSTKSNYVTYGKLDKVLRPLYIKHGFSLSFDTEESEAEGIVRCRCYVSHVEGHTRIYRADVPSDGKGAKGGDVMTKTHAFGSGASYGMRYLLKMIFNVAVGEDDDDGNGGRDGKGDDQKAVELLRRLMEHNAALRDWMHLVLDIIEHFREPDPDLEAIAVSWSKIPQDAQRALWVAPSKGGIFTTVERATIHENLPKVAA
jgi:hypothetical protein